MEVGHPFKRFRARTHFYSVTSQSAQVVRGTRINVFLAMATMIEDGVCFTESSCLIVTDHSHKSRARKVSGRAKMAITWYGQMQNPDGPTPSDLLIYCTESNSIGKLLHSRAD